MTYEFDHRALSLVLRPMGYKQWLYYDSDQGYWIFLSTAVHGSVGDDMTVAQLCLECCVMEFKREYVCNGLSQAGLYDIMEEFPETWLVPVDLRRDEVYFEHAIPLKQLVSIREI